MISKRMSIGWTVGATFALGMACSDATDGNDFSTVRFGLQKGAEPGAQPAINFATSAGEQLAEISPDTVASLKVEVVSIEVLPVPTDDQEGDPGPWIAVELAQPDTIDLAALPTTEESPLIVASGSLMEGSYSSVRLFVSGGVIVFTGPIDLGNAQTFAAGEEHDVTIPSADQTGIKTDMAFEVMEDMDMDVILFFDEAASYANVSATGNGEVILAPVIRAPAQDEGS